MATSNALTLDALFTRQLYFRDASNRPISANQVLTTRGDGGIYFAPLSTNALKAFNTVQAGSNITIQASNAVNTLWFEPGAGIQYYSNVEAGQTKLYIAATGPEQLTVVGDGTLNFSSLRDTIDGGRTLFYKATGDASIYISDTTVVFDTVYNSSYSSLTALTSTSEALVEQQSTLTSQVNAALSTVDVLLLSTSISSF
jgi:hypothetical protein